ncbi:MAG: response regulator [Thermoleophilia bacterium]|nr:response regulator [Thermoleophilia bacterium]
MSSADQGIPSGVDFGPERILVVDDEPGVRRFLVRAIESGGYRVASGDDAGQALEHLSSGEFGAALVDIRMPGKDGLWLLDRVVERGLDVAVVMVTANNEVRTAVDCLTRGAVNYVIKPVNPEELVQVVARVLEDRRLRIENRAYRRDLERLVGERTLQLENAMGALKQANVALERAYRESLYRLAAAAEYRDEETGNHIRRMGMYSHLIARGMGLDDDFLTLVLLASPMHDVGKIGIRDSVLLKPAKLTPEEFDEIRAHTMIGARILAGSESPLLQMAEEIALNHHERFDGSGYPNGLRGEAIPLSGRIVALADVFDALTSRRVYRPPYSVEEAVDMIREGAGTHFDPRVARAFDGALDEILRIKGHYEDPDASSVSARNPILDHVAVDGLGFLESMAGRPPMH